MDKIEFHGRVMLYVPVRWFRNAGMKCLLSFFCFFLQYFFNITLHFSLSPSFIKNIIYDNIEQKPPDTILAIPSTP